MPGEPDWEIDIEVIVSIIGIARRERGERTRPAIGDEHNGFNQHDPEDNGGGAKPALISKDWQRQDTRNHECPDGGVDDFDYSESCIRNHPFAYALTRFLIGTHLAFYPTH
jgi:hypothetical protein